VVVLIGRNADVFMQDDGARSERFSPYFGNTGFYYVRHSLKTEHLMQVSPHCHRFACALPASAGTCTGIVIGTSFSYV
jgi:hypothetical protein